MDRTAEWIAEASEGLLERGLIRVLRAGRRISRAGDWSVVSQILWAV